MRALVPILAIMALFLASVSVAYAQTTTPTVSTVAVTSDPGTDLTYALGDTIEVGLTFDEAVTVTGDPYLLIDVGGTNRRASYHSGSTTTQLLFRYTVLAGDDDADGIAVVTNSLTLNGGTIGATDDATAATLDNAALATTGHKVDVVVTLLSNLGQTAGTSTATVSDSIGFVGGFQTGSHAGGYDLTEVVLDVKTPSDTLDVVVRIRGGTGQISDIDRDNEYRLSGSVTNAGPQSFTLNDDEVGHLRPNATYFLVVSGTGAGVVGIGSRSDEVFDDVSLDGWSVPETIFGQFIRIPRFSLKGYLGVTPHLYHAHVSSSPNQDNTYSAGENIEVDLAFSEVVRLADPSYRLPIRFGDTDKYVYAEPVNDSGLVMLFSYTVQSDDVSTGNVKIADSFLFLDDNVTPAFVNHFDSAAPIRTGLSFATVVTEGTHPVDGTQSWECEHLLCAYMTFTQHPSSTDLGFLAYDIEPFRAQHVGELTNRSIKYAGHKFAVNWLILLTDSFPIGNLVIAVSPELPDEILDRLSLDVDSTEFRFSEATESTAYVAAWNTNANRFVWSNSGLDWQRSDRILVKIIENTEVSFAADSYSTG